MNRITLPLSLKLYRAASVALEPAAAALLRWRAGRGKEDPQRIAERRGHPGAARPDGTLIWAHGASVGETISLMPLVERLVNRGLNVLVTSGTVTSAHLLAHRLPPGARHQYLPLDVPRYMRRFLDAWQPDLALVAESEIWPNMIIEARRREIPLVMVNGRMSERSFRRWSHMPDAARAALSAFDLCLAQSQGDAERLARLGAPRVANSGNLKFDVPPPPADPGQLALLQGLTAGRPVWMAASTHPGEEEQIIAAHRALAPHLPRLLTVIAPRHPQRGGEIESLARQARLNSAVRSQGLLPDGAVDLYIVDTVGELGLFYRLASLVFMGGSLVPHGGQNPIEPARLGAAILHGPHVHNFTDVYAALDQASGAFSVGDADTLRRLALRFLTDTASTRAAARAAASTVNELGGAADKVMQALDTLLMHISLRQRRSKA